jgi:hypothetical protein
VTSELRTVPRAAGALRRDWAALSGRSAGSERFTEDSAAELPEPVRRWLTHAIAPGTPLRPAVVLGMHGRIRLGRWQRFTAREVLAPPEGFIWAATARAAGLPITGFDRFSSGTGEMRWRLLGVVPVMSASGPDVTASAAGRLAAEALLWLPTAYRAATWTAGPEPDTAVAGWRTGDTDEAVLIRVGPEGRLAELRMQRWGDPDGGGFGRYPFGVAVQGERCFGGVTIASRVRAGWSWGTARQDEGEFFTAEITDAAFD